MLMQQVARVRMIWGKFSQNQKVGVMFVGVAAVLAVGYMLLMRPPQRYETAFSGLQSDDAAAIVEQLRGQGIPYQLSADGTTVRVPGANVADVRLNAAANGLPKGGGVGFELFDKSSFGITEFAQQVNYQRALEGELQRTINKIDAVASSRVHIVIPQESLFTKDEQPTTAAVVLQFKPGGQLSPQQIKGVTYLVSSSVPGLKPENLTVVDETGAAIWSGADESNSFAGADDNFAKQKAYETDLARQLETMINRVVGSGQAAVKVSAVLNWDQKTTDSEIFSPDGTQAQIRSQQESTNSTSGSTTGAAGVPGTDSNSGSGTDTYQAGTPTAGSDQQASKDVTTNYELSRKVERVVQAPGKVERLSVAVVLNDKEVDPVVTQEIQGAITAAAGIDANRGDSITVTAVPFKDSAAAPVATAGPGMVSKALGILKILGLILAPIIAIFFARRVLLQQQPVLHPAVAAPGFPPNAAQLTRRMSMTEVPRDARMVASMPARQQSKAQAQAQVAESDPAQLAVLIRTWMNEEQ